MPLVQGIIADYSVLYSFLLPLASLVIIVAAAAVSLGRVRR
jgi:hypothetical protein